MTVTATGAEVVTLPAASRATAVTLWVPLATVVELHDIPYGAVVSSPPTLVPSTLNCTPATPTLSAALAAKFTVPDTVAPAAGAVTDTVGAWVSGAALETVIDTGAEVVTLPAASRATAVTLWVPLATDVEFHDIPYGDGGVLAADVGAVDLELHADHADVVRRVGRQVHRHPTPSPPPPAPSPTPSAPRVAEPALADAWHRAAAGVAGGVLGDHPVAVGPLPPSPSVST